LRRDIVSAYLVTAARVFAWIVVTGSVVRVAGRGAFAILALVQTTVGILEYAAIGLSPAIIRMSAEAIREMNEAASGRREGGGNGDGQGDAGDHPGDRAGDHADNRTGENSKTILNDLSPAQREPVKIVYANGFALGLLTAMGGLLLIALFVPYLRNTQANIANHGVALELIVMVGISTLIRMVSDAPGAALQTCGKIFIDNVMLTVAELIWGIGTAFNLYVLHLPWQRATGSALLIDAVVLLVWRTIVSHQYGSGVFDHWWKKVNTELLRKLMFFGLMVVAAQAADYLYAPTDQLLIAKLIDLQTVAIYSPAVMIDAAALLLVNALASVLLPRTALAHAAGNSAIVRRYYIRGTLATFLLLLAAAPIAWLASPIIFQLWLGTPMTETVSILKLMLIHTVIGGSSVVGRSILLAIGKVRPFTISVVVAGIVNVFFSFVFVYFFHLGLTGIVLGTIVAVTGRCAIWLPWYVMRTLNKEQKPTEREVLDAIPG
jgi:O-antigen/teichoic acid export membrane protein